MIICDTKFHLQMDIQMIHPMQFVKCILIRCSISILQWGICSFCSLNISEVEFLLYLIWFDQWWDWFFCETCRQYFFWSFDIISLELLEWPAPQFQYKGNRFWSQTQNQAITKGFYTYSFSNYNAFQQNQFHKWISWLYQYQIPELSFDNSFPNWQNYLAWNLVLTDSIWRMGFPFSFFFIQIRARVQLQIKV